MRRKRNYPKHGIRAKLLMLLLLCILAIVLVAVRIRPIVLEYASNTVQYTATMAINTAMQDKIYQNRAQYEELVVLERDNENQVTALKTDVISINNIKTELVNDLYESINNLEQTEIGIPIGTVLAPNYLTGRGPMLKIGMTGLGFASAEFISAFTQAGINQTRHNIIIEVQAEVAVLTPLGTEKTVVTSRFNVTDTVIVGTVPEQYTYIDDTEHSLLGKINDYSN